MEDTFKLDKNIQKPVIQFDFISMKNCRALVDTGAYIPVWTLSEKSLVKMGACKVENNVQFGGFGGTVSASLYIIPLVMLKGMIYIDLPIVVENGFSAVYNLIIPATMFQGMKVEFDFENKFMKTIYNDYSRTIKLKYRIVKGCLDVYYDNILTQESKLNFLSLNELAKLNQDEK